jgi:hypothetical protein
MDAPCRAGPAPSPSRTLCHTRLPPAGVWSGGRAAQQTGLASSAQFPFPSPAPAAPVGGGSTLTHGEGVWKGPTIQWVRGSAGMG